MKRILYLLLFIAIPAFSFIGCIRPTTINIVIVTEKDSLSIPLETLETLSIDTLNISPRTIDKAFEFIPYEFWGLYYSKCPKCGSELEKSHFCYPRIPPIMVDKYWCPKCGWRNTP